MDFMGLFLGACTVLIATTAGAAGVLAFKRIQPRYYATLVAFCAGMMGFSALEMIDESHALSGHRLALAIPPELRPGREPHAQAHGSHEPGRPVL